MTLPDDAMGTLTFHRGRTWQDFARSYDVYVDGLLAGRIRRSSELSVRVAPGSHSCRAGISSTGSQTVETQVKAGHSTRVNILPGNQGTRVERALSTDAYLRLVVEK